MRFLIHFGLFLCVYLLCSFIPQSFSDEACSNSGITFGNVSLECNSSNIYVSINLDLQEEDGEPILSVLSVVCTGQNSTTIHLDSDEAKESFQRNKKWSDTVGNNITSSNVSCELIGCFDLVSQEISFPKVSCSYYEESQADISTTAAMSSPTPTTAMSSSAPTATYSAVTEMTTSAPPADGNTNHYYILLLSLPFILFTVLCVISFVFISWRDDTKRKREIRLGTWLQDEKFDKDYMPIDITRRRPIRHSNSCMSIFSVRLFSEDVNLEPHVINIPPGSGTTSSSSSNSITSGDVISNNDEGIFPNTVDTTGYIGNRGTSNQPSNFLEDDLNLCSLSDYIQN